MWKRHNKRKNLYGDNTSYYMSIKLSNDHVIDVDIIASKDHEGNGAWWLCTTFYEEPIAPIDTPIEDVKDRALARLRMFANELLLEIKA